MPRMGLPVVRGKISLLKVEHPRTEGHVMPTEDEYPKNTCKFKNQK